MKLFQFLLFLFILSFSQICMAENTLTATPSATERLNSLLSNIDTFKANFIQNIETETGEQLEQLSGEIAIKKPGKFYWNVSQPFEQKLVADGINLWQYDLDLEQATVRSLGESLVGTPAEILMGSNTNLAQNFRVETISTTEINTLEKFLLLPLEEGQFESVAITFNAEVLILLELKDTLGQTTRIDFINTQFGMALSDSLFIMNLPSDVELIDSRTIN